MPSSKLDRLRKILTDTTFIENKARQLVRKVFVEEEVRIEALLLSATRQKLHNIDNLFEKLGVIEDRFFEMKNLPDGSQARLVDYMAAEDLIELYKTLARTLTDQYKDIQEDTEAIKNLEVLAKAKDNGSLSAKLSKEHRQDLKLLVDRVLTRIGNSQSQGNSNGN